MNDLAQMALHGADAARRAVVSRPVPVLSVLGLALAGVVVFTGGRIGASPAAVPIHGWLGLLPDAEYRVQGIGMGTVMFAAVIALVLLWLLAIRVSRLRRFAPRQVWTIAAAWSLPFVVGPPLLSTDVFGYVARGLLARSGLDPYRTGPDALGNQRVVAAIDPAFRTAHSTDGPLSTLISHLAVSVSNGQVPVALIVLRAVSVAGVIALGVLASDLAGERRSAALCLTVLNPAVLLYLVSAGQYAGLMIVFVLAALVAGAQRRWVVAVVFTCLAAAMKPIALVALPAVIAANALGHPPRLMLRVVVRDVAVAAVVLAAIVLSVPDGLGWVRNIADGVHDHVPFAPSSIVGQVLGWIVQPATFDDLATGGRIAAIAAGVTALLYLYATVATRPLDRTIAYALIAAGTLAPVIYPSFLLWGSVVLAATALGARQDWVVALSCAACVLSPIGFGERGAIYVTSAALGLIAVVLLPRLLVRAHHDTVIGGRRFSVPR